MKKFTLLFFFAALIMSLSISCGDDDGNGGNENPPGDCTANFNQDVATELSAANDAATVWANAMTEENCNALKDAYNVYLDALEDWEDCADFYNQVTEWEQALDALRQTINTLC